LIIGPATMLCLPISAIFSLLIGDAGFNWSFRRSPWSRC
jgi:hypothetical protein